MLPETWSTPRSTKAPTATARHFVKVWCQFYMKNPSMEILPQSQNYDNHYRLGKNSEFWSTAHRLKFYICKEAVHVVTNLAIHGTACFTTISTAGKCDESKSTRSICVTIFRNMHWKHTKQKRSNIVAQQFHRMQQGMKSLPCLWPIRLMPSTAGGC